MFGTYSIVFGTYLNPKSTIWNDHVQAYYMQRIFRYFAIRMEFAQLIGSSLRRSDHQADMYIVLPRYGDRDCGRLGTPVGGRVVFTSLEHIASSSFL